MAMFILSARSIGRRFSQQRPRLGRWSSSHSSSSRRRRPLLYTYIPEPLDYDKGLALQEALVERRLEALSGAGDGLQDEALHIIAETDLLLLLQHTPVYTAGRREKPQESLEEAKRLSGLGAKYCHSARGGLTTYHGPGQLVGYPIVHLAADGTRTRTFVEKLEQVLELVVQSHGIKTVKTDHTGVWTSPDRKIASIGLQIRQAMTSHGFALNVEDSVLPWFKQIIACGIVGAEMTTMNRQLQDPSAPFQRTLPLTVPDIVPDIVKAYGQVYDRDMVRLGEEQFHDGGVGHVLSQALGGTDFDQKWVKKQQPSA